MLAIPQVPYDVITEEVSARLRASTENPNSKPVTSSNPGCSVHPHPNRRPLRDPHGFSLVITISMMVLLSLLAVGLISLAGVSLRSSKQGDAMATARANARLSLVLALGQLQKQLGPDRRINAPADQSANTAAAHGPWVGVYDSWSAQSGLTSRPSPVFREWLVSSPSEQSLSNPGLPSSTSTGEVLMAGEGSLGPVADLQKVTVPFVPAVGTGGNGRLAWWVGDESSKAHVVAGNPRPGFADSGEDFFGANSGITANAEVLDALGEIGLDDEKRAFYLSPPQLGLVNQAAPTLFHDVTTQSRGLAVDVTRGRFKLDYSLLSQLPRRSVSGLPLYKADGAINNFTVANGRMVNDSAFRSIGSNPIAAFGNASNQPGINMEELWIYSNLYRNLTWTGGNPELRLMTGAESPSAADFRRRALSDPWLNYSKPVFAAIQFVFSFVSRPDTANPGKFRMLLQMDVLVKVWNPNNVRVVIPQGASFAVQLLAVPFKVQWLISPATGTAAVARPQSGIGNNTYSFAYGPWASSTNRFGQRSFQWLRGNIGGLARSGVSTGYTLEPGESKIFGHDRDQSSASWSGDPNVNLSPGWGPGRQALIVADFGANNLNANDTIEFIVTPDKDPLPSGGTRTYCNKWIGERAAGAASSGGNGGLALGGSTLPTTIDFTNPDPLYFPNAASSQRLTVAQYATPKPFMIFGTYLNVEQPSSGTQDAFPSAARLLTNTGINSRRFRDTTPAQLTSQQEIWRANPLAGSYDSPLIDINSRDQGRFGGGHSPSLGVTRAATRQIDPAPPLSLMALSHAMANGFADRFGQVNERASAGLDTLQSDGLQGAFKFEAGDIAFSGVTYAAPQVERAIGNSFASPLIAPGSVTGSGPYHVVNNSVPLFDHSYLANAALFDSWFCSSLHDGRLFPRNSPFQDSRSGPQVLADFIDKSRSDEDSRLLNPRVQLASDPTLARQRLLNGGNFHGEAISRMGAHVWLDGAFNVNSTRKNAWKSLLASARDQSRRSSTGQRYDNNGKTPVGSSGLVAAGPASATGNTTEIEQWSGFRALSDQDLDALAERIVTEVRSRGPFLSLADFINRRPRAQGDAQWLGAVQAAIENAGLNAQLKSGNRGLSPAHFGSLPGAGVASAAGGMGRSAGIPGYVMQSDVLAPVANELSPRSDTFRIRGYGAATDAAGRVVAEAWCEAIVQRLPEYVDPTEAAETAADALQRPVNQRFGRRFTLVSFQWLPREAI